MMWGSDKQRDERIPKERKLTGWESLVSLRYSCHMSKIWVKQQCDDGKKKKEKAKILSPLSPAVSRRLALISSTSCHGQSASSAILFTWGLASWGCACLYFIRFIRSKQSALVLLSQQRPPHQPEQADVSSTESADAAAWHYLFCSVCGKFGCKTWR